MILEVYTVKNCFHINLIPVFTQWLHQYAKKINDVITCDEYSRYRTSTGKCNNLIYKWWGSSMSPYHRFLSPNFADGIEKPVTKINGRKLFSPDTVSKIMPNIAILSGYNTYYIYFGQFVAHDLGNTVKGKEKCDCSSKSEECVNIPLDHTPLGHLKNKEKSIRNYSQQKRVGKYSIKTMAGKYKPKSSFSFKKYAKKNYKPKYASKSSKSRHYKKEKSKKPVCHSMVRDDPSWNVFPCKLSHREHYSSGNYWLDMDPVYGSNDEQMNKVREFKYGRLKMSRSPGSKGFESLPIKDHNMCTKKKPTVNCFHSADHRGSNTPSINLIHTIWNRKHNIIAAKLLVINPHWTDEILFQEARRINIAIYQNIIYNEYLSILLGSKVMKEFKLNPLESGYFQDYNDKIYPNTYNEFVTSAYRLHHLIHNSIEMRDHHYNVKKVVELKHLHFNQNMIFEKLEELLYGATGQATYAPIFQMAKGLKKYLMTDPEHGMLNLAAINIQRGREHGLKPYAFYRKIAGQNYPNNFDELFDVNPKIIHALKKVYKNVEDIDLYVGILVEQSLDGGMMGRTGSYIIAQEFFTKKYADRFYYENDDKYTRFTRMQLKQIRKYTFSSLFCDAVYAKKAPKFGFYEIRNPHDPYYRHSKDKYYKPDDNYKEEEEYGETHGKPEYGETHGYADQEEFSYKNDLKNYGSVQKLSFSDDSNKVKNISSETREEIETLRALKKNIENTISEVIKEDKGNEGLKEEDVLKESSATENVLKELSATEEESSDQIKPRQKRDYAELLKYMYEDENILADCRDMFDLDLSLWKDYSQYHKK